MTPLDCIVQLAHFNNGLENFDLQMTLTQGKPLSKSFKSIGLYTNCKPIVDIIEL